MEAIIYNKDGKKSGNVTLPEDIFGVQWNDSLMHQVVTSMLDNARTPVAHTKDRGAVRGGGKKPWKQKGTGRARHGSIRSPIWRGGGVTHGPLNAKNYTRRIPKQMRAKALFMALSKKYKDGELIFVDTFGMTAPKTADAKKALLALSKIDGFTKLATKRSNAAVVALPERNEATEKSFSNIGSVSCMQVRDLNPVDVLKSAYIVIAGPETAIQQVASRSKKAKAAQK